MTPFNLDTNDRTAPTAIWNAYHQARRNPPTLAELHQQDVTSDVLRNWAYHPERQSHIRAALQPFMQGGN